MNKIYDRIYWHNNTTPALNETNLNAMSAALDGLDDRVIALAADIMINVPTLREDLEAAEALEERLESYVGRAEDSEAWAVGQRDGTDVPPTDETYHNNSKYYANHAEDCATTAQTAAETATEALEDIEELITVTSFSVDFTTGELMYTNEDAFLFTINKNSGELEWEVVT